MSVIRACTLRVKALAVGVPPHVILYPGLNRIVQCVTVSFICCTLFLYW